MKKIKINKRIIIILIILACIVVFVFGRFVIYKMVKEYQYSAEMESISAKNENTIFSIDKIMLYSSAGAVDKSEGATMQDLNICQFTDIAVYINNKGYIEELKDENTVKELYINNIKLETPTERGIKKVAYKNPNDFGKFSVSEEDTELTENQTNPIYFNVIYTNENNEKSDYSTPRFFTDCSNPITLSYINSSIVTGYAVSSQDTQIKFDGNILQSVGVNLDEIACKLSFDINIKNNLDEEFVCNVGIDMPLKSEDRSIYNGYMYGIQSDLQSSYPFFRK